jgi:hypothetical protein
MQEIHTGQKIPSTIPVGEMMIKQHEHGIEQVQQTLSGEELSTLPKVRTTDGQPLLKKQQRRLPGRQRSGYARWV